MFEPQIRKREKIKSMKKFICLEKFINTNPSIYLEEEMFYCSEGYKFFEFNPNEYIMENIYVQSDFEKCKKEFEDEKNFSLYRHYKYNHLFENNILEEEYKNNIIKMLKSDVIGEAYDDFSKFKSFKNPFKGKNNAKMIEQINKVKYYIYFPISKINGLTFKKIGVIFINKILKNMDNINEENKLIKFSINISNKKITECDEIFANYMLTICNANEKDIAIFTLENPFLNYTSNKAYYLDRYDGGDRLESILFGNKIIYLTIQSSLYILNENNWNNNNIDTFRKKFLEKNMLQDKENEVDFSNESKILSLIRENININKITKKIIVERKNSFIVFKKGFTIKENDDEIILSSDEEEEYYEKFSLTSNAFHQKKMSISKLFEEYDTKSEGK